MPIKALSYKNNSYIHTTPSRKTEQRSNAGQRGYDNNWRKARKHYLSMHPLCIDCKNNNLYTSATEIHHTYKAKEYKSLFYDDSLWMPLCKSCHSSRTARGE